MQDGGGGGGGGVEPQEGDLVRVVGLLSKPEYNHHVGRVRIPVVPSKVVDALATGGRVEVELHGVIWPALSSSAPAAAASPPPARNRRGAPKQNTISVKVKNLAAIGEPSTFRSRPPPAELARWYPTAGWAVVRLLGPTGFGLPEHLAELVAGLLDIEVVDGGAVWVADCSSDRGDYPLQAVLEAGDSWWISGPNMPAGRGTEWLEFSLSPPELPGPRRLSYIGIKIPPLPGGPLSVRRFHLQARRPDGAWVPAGGPHEFVTLDRPALQELAVCPPVETDRIRLVCTENALAGSDQPWCDCIGLFELRFA